ncbi:MAG: tol-pal system YbgF family protein [Planctomycetota bacterium JB042]
MRRRRPPLLFPPVSFAALLLAGTTFAAESTAVAAYSGKCTGPGGFAPLTVELSLAPIDALEALRRRLPSLEESASTLVLEIVDAAPEGAPDAPPVLGLTVRPFSLDPEAIDRVRLFAEPFFAETVDPFREAARAVAEATIRLRIGDGAPPPEWLLDGLGQWVTEDGAADEGGRPAPPTYGWHLSADRLVPGLDVGPWTPWRRFEARRAIGTLIRLGGADAPDLLAAALARGEDARATIEVLVARTWEEFVAAARDDARTALRGRRTDATAPLLDGWEAARRGEWPEAIEGAQRVVAQDDRTLHPEALWLGAYALNELGRPEEALKPIEHFFHLLPDGSDAARALIGDEAPPARHLLGRILFERARAFARLDDRAAAEGAVAEMLLRSPDGERVADARRLLRDG